MMNELIRVNPLLCEEHPALKGFPMASHDVAEVLRQSIREHGLLEPLKVCRENGESRKQKAESGDLEVEKWFVVDGRNRLAALKALGIEDAPALVVEADPVEYALETAIARRQLTKSGVVLLLFERHPELAERKGKRETPGQKHSIGGRFTGVERFNTGEEETTFRKLAEKFGVDVSYFSILAKIAEKATPEEWEIVRAAVLYDEVSIPRIHAGLGGLRSGVDGNGKRKPVNHELVFSRSVTSFENTWAAWGKLKPTSKVEMAERWKACLAGEQTPEEIRHAVIDAMQYWPEHLRARAAVELRKGLK